MGYVEKLGERKYKATIRVGGRERSKTHQTRRDANNWINTNETSKLTGQFVDPRAGRIKVAEFAEKWIPTMPQQRPATMDRDRRTLNNHVLARFGKYKLNEVGQLDIQQWIADLERSGLAPATIQKCVQVASKLFRGAVKARYIAANPCADLDLPTIERREMRFVDPDEIDTLADTIDQRYRAFIYVGAYCGLREGEAFGLRRHRVDLLRKAIDVAEIVVDVSGTHHVGPPKTRAGRRAVPMPGVVIDELETHMASLGRDDLVFPAPAGGLVRASLFRRRIWQPACVAAGLGEIVKEKDGKKRYVGLRIHDLRHSAVSLWIAAGASPKEIAVRAGHTSVSVVLDRYGHLFDGHESKVNDALDELARKARTKRSDGNNVVGLR